MVGKAIGRCRSMLRVAWLKLKFGRQILIGKKTYIGTDIRIDKTSSLSVGDNCGIFHSSHLAAVCGGKIIIGDNISINRNCLIVAHDMIEIGSNAILGPNVAIYDHDHRFGAAGIQPGFRTAAVRVGEGVWIGANSILLRGATVGKGSVIGAGTVISGKIPPYSLVTSRRELIVEKLEDRTEK